MPWDLIDRRRDEDDYPAATQKMGIEERIRIAKRIRETTGR